MKKFSIILIIIFVSIKSYAQYTEFVWDTITFEEPYEYIEIDTSNQNIWQIGEPNKTVFDSAFSKTKAIITDSINFYPINNYSYFDLKIGNFNIDYYPYDIFIEIKHKFDTDTLKDGGFITVSYDNGVTWMNIIKDTVYWEVTPGWENVNLYSSNDTLFNGDYGFSGKSNDWISTWFTWHILPVKKNKDFIGDTMVVRFNFISDNFETNQEGWMIDNIKLYSVDLGGSINENRTLNFNIFPNPLNDNAIIELDNYYNKLELCVFDIQGNLVKKQNFENINSMTLNINNLKSGLYFIKLKSNNNLVGVKKIIIQ